MCQLTGICGAVLVSTMGVLAACSSDPSPEAPSDAGRDARVRDAGGIDDAGTDADIDAGMEAHMDAGGTDTGTRRAAPISPADRDAGNGQTENRDAGRADADAGDDEAGGCVEDPSEAICGDRAVDEGEQCDDGKNGDPNDGCRDDCSYSCVDATGDCADETGDCQQPVCTTGELGMVCGTEADETDVPDDDNPCTDDFCDGSLPRHSDLVDGYPCENGSGLDGDYCDRASCIDPVCGDGVRGPLEQCDDGANVSGDGCSSDCVLEECGDGKLDSGEDCDDNADGDADDGCDDSCHFSCSIPELDCPADSQGDCAVPACEANAIGQVCGQQADLEDVPMDDNPCTDDLCDPGPENQSVEDGTDCDNEAGAAGDYCHGGVCIDPACGDGVRGRLEECDHEDEINGIGCSPECEIACPEFTVRIPSDSELDVDRAFCMDKYEASRSDATFDSMGSDTSVAVSQPGVIPWSVTPMSATALATFQSACSAAGKHLCTKQRWYTGCTGPDRNTYAFGNSFDPEICNCVATFCDDYCADHGIDPGSCNTNISNCGYYCGEISDPPVRNECFHVEPTGQYPGCANAFGAMDMSGNLWEIVPSEDDARGYEIRGGAFNCAGPTDRLQCTFNATWTSLYAGFRCCADTE